MKIQTKQMITEKKNDLSVEHLNGVKKEYCVV